MASIDLYTKQQIDAKIPDTTGASNGDVLTFNGTNTVWAPSSGGGGSASIADILAATTARILDYYEFDTSSSYEKLGYIKDDGTSGLLITTDVSITVLGTTVTIPYTGVTVIKSATLDTDYSFAAKTITLTINGNSYTIKKTMMIYDNS